MDLPLASYGHVQATVAKDANRNTVMKLSLKLPLIRPSVINASQSLSESVT